MNSKERILRTLELKPVDQVGWVPWVGAHAANLLEINAKRLFTEADTLVEGVMKGYELYQPDGLPTLFDVQLEAEALGCEIAWSDDNPPAVVGHVLEKVDLNDLWIPTPDQGRFPMALNAARKIVSEIGDHIAIFALITGPFTLTLHLAGVKIFTDMYDNPDQVKEILSFASKVCEATARYYAETGVDVITVVDSLTSQISSDHFKMYVTPYHQNTLETIHRLGKKSGFFACGDATRNVEAMASIGAHFFGVDENVDLNYARDVAHQHNVAFAGNLPLASVMLFGTSEDNYNTAIECLKTGGEKGFFLCPGCDIPFATPIENVQAITRAVREFHNS
jgi:MtaA/CmuA family methyltransferase